LLVFLRHMYHSVGSRPKRKIVDQTGGRSFCNASVGRWFAAPRVGGASLSSQFQGKADSSVSRKCATDSSTPKSAHSP
jgi:hypothetical protein